jgi:NTE family protein
MSCLNLKSIAMRIQSAKPKIALALGAGAARGWAHVGVIRALESRGIMPDLICGTSIGALVGAAYASGELDRFEAWIRRLSVLDIVSFMDLSLNGGLIKGEKLMSFFAKTFDDRPIETLGMPFGAVACDLHTGAEVWLREGSTAKAVRSSIALPGLLTPAHYNDKTLVDGGLVNPVPVSLARAMGADIVIAVDLNADLIGRHLQLDSDHQTRHNSTAPDLDSPEPLQAKVTGWFEQLQKKVQARWPAAWPSTAEQDRPPVPSMFDVVASSINIMQVRITRSRMAGEPPDAIVTPRLAHMGLMDFHQAQLAIDEGSLALERAWDSIEQLL